MFNQGFGVYQYPNPFFRYEGTWQDGKKHGTIQILRFVSVNRIDLFIFVDLQALES